MPHGYATVTTAASDTDKPSPKDLKPNLNHSALLPATQNCKQILLSVSAIPGILQATQCKREDISVLRLQLAESQITSSRSGAWHGTNIESLEHSAWKTPLRSSSPNSQSALPSSPLTHVPKCHLHTHIWTYSDCPGAPGLSAHAGHTWAHVQPQSPAPQGLSCCLPAPLPSLELQGVVVTQGQDLTFGLIWPAHTHNTQQPSPHAPG